MRRIKINGDDCIIDQVCGYTVLAVKAGAPFDGYHLAFCSAKDRLSKKWSREDGYKIAKDREAVVGATVRECITTQVLFPVGDSYIPHTIAAAVLRAIETIPQGEAK